MQALEHVCNDTADPGGLLSPPTRLHANEIADICRLPIYICRLQTPTLSQMRLLIQWATKPSSMSHM